MPEAFGAGLIFKTPQPAAYVNLGAQPVLPDVHRQLFSELFADVHRIFVQISYSSVCGWGRGAARASWREESGVGILKTPDNYGC